LKHSPASSITAMIVSPPARGRGLKRPIVAPRTADFWSPPARGRGLKQEDG